MQKKNICFGKLNFFKKKNWFFVRFSAFYGQRSVTAAWATRSPWSIFSFLFSPSFAFDPLWGISRVRKFVSPNILAKLEDKCQKKCNFYLFLWKKADFQVFFRLFTASVWLRPPEPPAVPGVLYITIIQFLHSDVESSLSILNKYCPDIKVRANYLVGVVTMQFFELLMQLKS